MVAFRYKDVMQQDCICRCVGSVTTAWFFHLMSSLYNETVVEVWTRTTKCRFQWLLWHKCMQSGKKRRVCKTIWV